MNCGGLFFGTVLLVASLIYIGTGRIPSRYGRSYLWRNENPLQFWLYNLILSSIGIVFIIFGFTTHPHRRKVKNSIQNTPLQATTSASAPSFPAVTETIRDQEIAARLSKRSAWLMEGRDWETSLGFRRQDRPVGQLIDQMYNARAPKVYVDTVGADDPGSSAVLLSIYIELPPTAEEREACFKAVAQFQKTNAKCFVIPTLPTAARYLEIKVFR